MKSNITSLSQLLAAGESGELAGRMVTVCSTGGEKWQGPLLAMYMINKMFVVELEQAIFRGGLDIGGAWHPTTMATFYTTEERVAEVSVSSEGNVLLREASTSYTIHAPEDTDGIVSVRRVSWLDFLASKDQLIGCDLVEASSPRKRGPIKRVDLVKGLGKDLSAQVQCAWVAEWRGFGEGWGEATDAKRVFEFPLRNSMVYMDPDSRWVLRSGKVGVTFIYAPGDNLVRDGIRFHLSKK